MTSMTIENDISIIISSITSSFPFNFIWMTEKKLGTNSFFVDDKAEVYNTILCSTAIRCAHYFSVRDNKFLHLRTRSTIPFGWLMHLARRYFVEHCFSASNLFKNSLKYFFLTRS
mmetsp:Transcript_39264/g.44862  ORF Transcript_39264/g.44862 Transcript_39264/m.44862 type:complete len:115 (-) Transcript_39264:301-645(-)